MKVGMLVMDLEKLDTLGVPAKDMISFGAENKLTLVEEADLSKFTYYSRALAYFG